jgi:hypothetical protein
VATTLKREIRRVGEREKEKKKERRIEGESVGATMLERAMVERGTEWQRWQRR